MKVERLRGRPGMEQRRHRLRLYPICAECEKLGIVRPTDIIDHRIPLDQGGEDTDENCQGLCLFHNAIKTSAEGSSRPRAEEFPGWLKPSAVRLAIVCGPPCAGKSTYVAAAAAPGDAVIDWGTILSTLSPGFRPWAQPLDPRLHERGLRARNAMLGGLAQKKRGRAFLVLSAPTHGERVWWRAKLGGEIILLQPGLAECKRRALERGTPAAVAAVDRWAEASLLSWAPPRRRPAKAGIGEDGYPLET